MLQEGLSSRDACHTSPMVGEREKDSKSCCSQSGHSEEVIETHKEKGVSVEHT